ncbi:hypothetical protein ACP4OV_031980 [Aristida adscensionis]
MGRATSIRGCSLLLVFLLLSLLPAAAPCPRVPTMTAARACREVCGTRDMHRRCRRTLSARRGGAAAAVTVHAAVAARSALDSYAATAAAAASLFDGASAGEKAAYGGCMVGYGRARGGMARVAGDLAAGGCELKAGYMEGLRGMDRCRRSLFEYPESPLYAMNLADRNKTLLAALLCSPVPTPPPDGRRL